MRACAPPAGPRRRYNGNITMNFTSGYSYKWAFSSPMSSQDGRWASQELDWPVVPARLPRPHPRGCTLPSLKPPAAAVIMAALASLPG